MGYQCTVHYSLLMLMFLLRYFCSCFFVTTFNSFDLLPALYALPSSSIRLDESCCPRSDPLRIILGLVLRYVIILMGTNEWSYLAAQYYSLFIHIIGESERWQSSGRWWRYGEKLSGSRCQR